MAYKNLSDFLEALEAQGELVRVRREVSPVLEIAEIADRAVKGEGPALLFENVEGSTMPVAINLFASRRRMLAALEISSYEEWDERLEFFLDPKPPEGLLEKLKAIPQGHRARRGLSENGPVGALPGGRRDGRRGGPGQPAGPDLLAPGRRARSSRCRSSSRGTRLPARRTSACTACRSTTAARRACTGRSTRTAPARRAATSARGAAWRSPSAIGCDPATVFSGVAPLPPGLSEFLFAGFLRGEAVPLVAGKTVDLLVPAEAEIVLEGYVEPGERRREGPFGDHTGFYSLDDDFPVFHVTAVTRRRSPVYLTTIVGRPPMEDGFLGEAVERLFLPLVKKTIPEIVDMHLPVEGIFHNLMIVSIDKRYPGHARKTMHAIWGTGQMMFTKTIVVVDRDVDLRNASGASVARPDGDRSGAGHRVRARARRRARLRLRASPATGARWESTRPASGRKRASTAAGPTRS